MPYLQLQLLIQEVRFFARKLAVRNNLTLRATKEISKGRILSVDDLIAWQRDTEAGLVNNEVVADCFNDGARIFNQVSKLVSGSGKVLAAKRNKGSL